MKAFDPREIVRNPEKFGVPTFEQFQKSYDKYSLKKPDALALIDKGSQTLAGYVQRHRFEIMGYRVDSLEEVERIASDHGILDSLNEYKAIAMPQSGYKCDILIKFMSPEEYARRKAL